MIRISTVILCALLLARHAGAQVTTDTRQVYWPQWRGPAATGFAPHGDPPTEWSETKNVRWKVAIPGRGHASPIVWGERVYIQTAVPLEWEAETQPAASAPAASAPSTGGPRGGSSAETQPGGGRQAGSRGARGPGGPGGPGGGAPLRQHKYMLLALERRTGQTAWATTVCEAVPHERNHDDASPVSNSPVTDGEVLIAYFGSRGVYALDMDGKVLWQKQLGQMQTRRGFGEGSSPALHGDTVVVTWDHEGQSFIVALDRKSGRELWRQERDEVTSWATPLVVTVDGQAQVVACATKRVRSYALDSGKLLWECGGMTENVIPTPVSDRERVYCISGFRGSALLAVRYGQAEGDIGGTPAIAWNYEGKGTPYVPSPLLYGNELYFLQENRAVLSCVDAQTGQAYYARARLEGINDVYASIVGAAERVYIVGRDGNTVVVRRGHELKIVATNSLDESFSASPAIADKELYLRGQRHLYCLAEE
jgi:outer membrane protein assembly factor BamB